ncbi:hypothetical protein L1049_028067 [Liquidambar formosana]|uniref:RING-type E3 ubiquitin transferase n=1 Tax=Liquidambar formosana TaxID=63359 RepID=A0AAP0WVV3_LIQFO
MPGIAENSTIAEHIRLRRPRNQASISYSDPTTPHIPSLIQSTRCKSSISSLLFSTFSTNTTTTTTTTNDDTDTTANNSNKKKNFTTSTFRGLGCAAPPQVSVPAVIRTSADWQEKKVRKKKQKKKSKTHQYQHQAVAMEGNTATNPPPPPPPPPAAAAAASSSSAPSDVWCGPGIGFSAADASVDCVVSRRNVSGRGKVDGEKVNPRERSSYTARRTANPEHISLLDFDSAFGPTHSGSDVFGARYYRHVRHRSPEGLAEILMLQSSLLMGGRLDGHDRFREWRLDVDNMTYEELLELGDRIGYVSTGLREDEIGRCLRKIKLSILDNMPSHLPRGMETKCSICQEEYEENDEMGKLNCGHTYHLHCIKHWLVQKNTCPVCKSEVAAQH